MDSRTRKKRDITKKRAINCGFSTLPCGRVAFCNRKPRHYGVVFDYKKSDPLVTADRLTCVLFWHSPAFMAGLCLQKPIQTLWPVSAFDSEFIRHCLPEYPAMRSNRKCLRLRLRQHPDRPLREPEHSHCLPGSPAMRSNRKCSQYRRRPDHRLYWGNRIAESCRQSNTFA